MSAGVILLQLDQILLHSSSSFAGLISEAASAPFTMIDAVSIMPTASSIMAILPLYSGFSSSNHDVGVSTAGS